MQPFISRLNRNCFIRSEVEIPHRGRFAFIHVPAVHVDLFSKKLPTFGESLNGLGRNGQPGIQ